MWSAGALWPSLRAWGRTPLGERCTILSFRNYTSASKCVQVFSKKYAYKLLHRYTKNRLSETFRFQRAKFYFWISMFAHTDRIQSIELIRFYWPTMSSGSNLEKNVSILPHFPFYDSFLILSEYLSASFQTRFLSNRHGFHRKNTPPAFLPEKKKISPDRTHALSGTNIIPWSAVPPWFTTEAVPLEGYQHPRQMTSACNVAEYSCAKHIWLRPQHSIWQPVSHLTLCTAGSL